MARDRAGFGWEDYSLLRRDLIVPAHRPIFFLWRLIFLGVVGGIVLVHTLGFVGEELFNLRLSGRGI